MAHRGLKRGADIDGEAAADGFGDSVSLNSDGCPIVAAGAMSNDSGGSNSGHVRIYKWNGSAWTQLGGEIIGELAEDTSGESISISNDGTVIAIGASQK